jgi:starch-binding outer membrane protein SusE/F
MKKLFKQFLLLAFMSAAASSCKEDIEQQTLIPPTGLKGFTASSSQIVLSSATENNAVVTFSYDPANFGVSVPASYSLQFDTPADTTGPNAWGKAVTVKFDAGSRQRSFMGKDFNSLAATQLGLPAGTASKLAVRLKAEIMQSTGAATTVTPVYSSMTLTVTPYEAIIIYPALVVKGGNSWVTPAVTNRTAGLVLTSSGFNSKYEGYISLPNADGWGGDGGNLWLSPAPNYMKVNADIQAMTISFTPAKFFISGDDNGWSTSATPMTYDAATKKWVANNVSLTAGKAFAFTANGGWDLSYKVDGTGKLVFAGPPAWGGSNIAVAKTGVYTVTLDLSGGAGNYTYSVK